MHSLANLFRSVATLVRVPLRRVPILRVNFPPGILVFILSLPCLLLAQSAPVLSYSTYLPQTELGEPPTFSVNSNGTACITHGNALYGYDVNGNSTFIVPDISQVSQINLPRTVFSDDRGNCFVAGNGPPNAMNEIPLMVAKFSSTGSIIYAESFHGSSTIDTISLASQIVADGSGNAYIVGSTNVPDFPLKNPIQNLLTGVEDVFVLKLDPSGSPIYSTYFGENDLGGATFLNSGGPAIAADANGNAYIAGGIDSTSANSTIPITSGAFQNSPKSPINAWVAKIDPNGKQIYGTYLGGSADDDAQGIVADSAGNAYVVGVTCSPDFPTMNAFQSTLATSSCSGPHQNSGFVTKINSNGVVLVYSTFFGGADGAFIRAVAVDQNGAAYVTGGAGGIHFPLLHAIQADFLNTISGLAPNPINQAFVAAFDSTGSALQYSTFFGGFDSNFSSGIGLDSARNVYIAGAIVGLFGNAPPVHGFPILNASNGLFQPFLSQCGAHLCSPDVFEGFLAKISPTSGTALASPTTVDFSSFKKGASSPAIAVLLVNVGSTDLQINNTAITGDYTINNNTCSGFLPSANHCEVDVVFGPTAGGTRTGVLTLTSNAPDSPRNIQLTGIGNVPIVSLSPTRLSLTSPSIGTSGPTQTVVLSNTGTDTLNITGLSIVGPNAADFSETHDCASTLSAGSSCNVNVTYKASTSNSEAASVQFIDDASNSPHTVTLSGVVSAFGLTLAPGSSSAATVSAGQMASFNLMIGGAGFSGNVTLTCTGAPVAATCSVPGSETVGSTPTAFQVNVTTTARSTASLLPRTNLPLGPVAEVVLFGLLVMILLATRRKPALAALAFTSLAVVLMASCGGGGSSGGGGSHGTPSGTSTIVLTAANGSASQSVNLTLNVN